MGARQSKRSVDITTTPKKEGLPAEGSVGDAAAPGDGKLERIEEADTKPTTNGIGPHTETVEEKNQDEATEKDKEEVKSEETKAETPAEAPAEAAEVTTPTEATPASQNTATSPESKETKKKEKSKKHKFSFRTFSFGKKDKTKPAREDTPKNGDVAKEEPLVEGGEEAENAAASSPTDKSEVSSPVECEAAAPAKATEAKEVEKPADEKKDEATSVEKEKPAEKVEAPVADKVEVSAEDRPTTGEMCTVSHTEPIATPSIIERKTSEDLPSRFPSSPPPTPIDPSPLQQAQQAAASATALAEALKLPAEAASNHQQSISLSSSQSFDEHTDTPKESIIANVPQVDQEETKKESTTKETPVPIDNDSTIAQVQCEKITKELNDAVKAENEEKSTNANELVIETEEGPIPVTENQTFEARPAMIIPEDKKVEILLDVGGIKDEISSTTVSDQMFAAGEKILPAECNSQESFTSASEPIVRTNEESDDIPPPLPESPAPALQETSKFLSFMNAEIPPLDLPEPISESLIEISHETLAETHQIPEDTLKSSSEKVPEILAETPNEEEKEQVPESFTETHKVLESLAETQKVLEEIPESLTEIHKVLEVVAESLVETQKVLETPETLAETQKVLETPETLTETQKVLESPENLSETLAESQKVVLETPENLPETPKDLESTLETLTEDKVLEEAKDHENTLETLPEIVKVLEETPKDKKEILEDKDDKIEIADITDSLELPPVIQQELITCDDDSFTYPLPPDDVSTREESPRIPMDSILTPPQSPNPGSVNCTMTTTTRTCNLEPMSENDSMMMERLADNETQASQLTNGHVAADDHQSTSEPEAPVENNVSANEVSTTESADEAPKVPPPAVPVEVTVAPALAPVITEDVASVTKAIEEIDITEKAVAAAVKEAIENSNANEIVVDSNHQSHLNE